MGTCQNLSLRRNVTSLLPFFDVATQSVKGEKSGHRSSRSIDFGAQETRI